MAMGKQGIVLNNDGPEHIYKKPIRYRENHLLRHKQLIQAVLFITNSIVPDFACTTVSIIYQHLVFYLGSVGGSLVCDWVFSDKTHFFLKINLVKILRIKRHNSNYLFRHF